MKWKIILIALVLVTALPAKAIDFITQAPAHVSVGQLFKVDFLLSTKQEEINALEGRVDISGSASVDKINNGNSIIKLWTEEPKIPALGQLNIKFGGIVPGGYNGERGVLFSVFLRAQEAGFIKINFSGIKVLKNDGLGTSLAVSMLPKELLIESAKANTNTPAVSVSEPIDNEDPETFVPLISRDPSMFDNAYFLSFVTQDKLSGIAYYELAKSSVLVSNYQTLVWKKVVSPYVLENNDLTKYLYVRAVDNQNNQRVAIVKPQMVAKDNRRTVAAVSIILAIVVVILFSLLFKLKK